MRLRKKFPSIWRSKEGKAFLAFLFPSLAGVVCFFVLPFADVFRRSFATTVTGEFNGVQNYRLVFQNQAFRLAVANTVKFTLVGIPLLLIAGLVLALILCGMESAQTFKSLYLFPLAMPTATVVLVWQMVFARQGFFNLLLTRIGEYCGLWGEVHTDYLGSGNAFWVLVISYVWKNTGYTVVLWLAGLMGIPREYIEAAKVDGAGRRQRFFFIILPNLKGSVMTIIILSFLNSFKIYREAYLVAGSYPHESIYLMQHIFNNWFVHLEFDKMAAAAVLTGFFLFAVILLFLKFWDKGRDDV